IVRPVVLISLLLVHVSFGLYLSSFFFYRSGDPRYLHFSLHDALPISLYFAAILPAWIDPLMERVVGVTLLILGAWVFYSLARYRSEEHTSELQSRGHLVCRLLLEKKKDTKHHRAHRLHSATGLLRRQS